MKTAPYLRPRANLGTEAEGCQRPPQDAEAERLTRSDKPPCAAGFYPVEQKIT